MKKAKPDVVKFRKIIEGFSDVKILVVGDLMLDEFVWGKVSRISPEAPIPVVKASSETCVPGGAANVAVNLSSMGAKVFLSGVIGKDNEGRVLKRELKSRKAAISGIIEDKDRPTTLKRRIIAHNQQVVRMDREVTRQVNTGVLDKIVGYCKNVISAVDGVVISDYGKGVVSEKLVRELRKLIKVRNLPVAVDPKTSRFSIYKWVTVITPNCREVEQNQQIEIDSERTLVIAGRKLLQDLDCEAVLITRGEDGMSLFESGGDVTHIPAVAREVYDVTGAGDTVTSVLVLSLACGASMKEAAMISNYAAGVVVGKRGTAAVHNEELITKLLESP